jgi:hypothetical protein
MVLLQSELEMIRRTIVDSMVLLVKQSETKSTSR